MRSMNSGIWLDVSSMGILALLLVIYQYRGDIPIRQNKILFSMVRLACVSTVADLVCGLYLEGTIPSSDWGFYIAKGVMVYAQTTNAFFLLLYVRELTKRRNTLRAQRVLLLFPYILQTVMVIVNVLIRSRDFLEGPSLHQFGIPTIIMTITSSYFVIMSVVLLFLHHSKLTPYTILALCAYLLFSYLGSIWQLNDPNIRLANFTMVLGLLNLYLTVQNPEEIIDGQTGCLNRKAFTKTTEVALEGKQAETIVVIGIKDFPLLTGLMDSASTTDLLTHLVASLGPIIQGSDLYRIAQDQFAVSFAPGKGLKAATNALLLFSQTWKTSSLSLTMEGYSCVIRLPEDASTMDTFFMLTEQLRVKAQEQTQEMNLIPVDQLDIQEGLRRQKIHNLVLDSDERNLILLFRPIYSAKEGKTSGLRASLALQDASVGIVEQDEFLPYADKNSSIFRYSEYLVRRCCALLGQGILRELGFTHLTVTLTSAQWLQFGLAELIIGYLAQYLIDPSTLSFEIKCETINQAPEGVRSTLMTLSERGVHIVITRYGEGFTEIHTNLRLSQATISLGSDQFPPPEGRALFPLIIHSSVELFGKIGFTCAVDGIQSEAEKTECLSQGVAYLSGSWFGGPYTLEELAHVR
jgi:EAL domain-containing protein (putative c-di-GMP-specific phosphodiesterase class I)